MSGFIHRAINAIVFVCGHWITFLLTTLTGPAWAVLDPEYDALKFVSWLAIWLSVAILHSGHTKDAAMHAKLDEIIRAEPEADDALRGIEKE